MKINNDTVYTTYGKQWDPEQFVEPTNGELWVKPFGGLWASVDESPESWKKWCEGERFNLEALDEKFDFKISPEAKILKIYSVEDAKNLPRIIIPRYEGFSSMNKPIDFESLTKEYDGMFVALSEDWGLYMELYGWDCDSLLVFNKDIVEVI